MGNKNSGKQISKISSERYITWDKDREKYRVSVPYEGKQKTLGKYKHLEDAIECRDKFINECVNVD